MDTPNSVTITNRQLWIDGKPFPWYLAEEGPTIEDRTGPGGIALKILHLPVMVIEDVLERDELDYRLSGLPIADLRTRSKVKIEQIGRSRGIVRVTPGNGEPKKAWYLPGGWDNAMAYARKHAR